jgi:integrase
MVDAALAKLRERHPIQARRALRTFQRVFDYAKAKGLSSGDNPAAWRGMFEYRWPRSPNNNQHYASMPYAEVPEFMKRLRARQVRGASFVALEFLILNAARTSEVLGAQWAEIDFANRVWIIPAHRMKARREHRVPLSDRSMALLALQREYARGDQFIFTGYDHEEMDPKNLRWVMYSMDIPSTVHGFRSSFRDWAAEQTDFDFYVVEGCLAHTIGSAVTRAYLRTDSIDKRRIVMNRWADYCG